MNKYGQYRDQWKKLLSAERVKNVPEGNKTEYGIVLGDEEEFRTPYEKDYCRLTFSASLRRLAGKTQVHPFAEIDYIHNRLTHSLEVSSVSHSLARRVIRFLEKDRGDITEAQGRDICWIVQSAGLAHDIGNPPFGHVGEDAIRVWAQELLKTERSILGAAYDDFAQFDGNAQAFRMLARPDLRESTYYCLTVATLGALMKYPYTVKQIPDKQKPKFSAFSSESRLFDQVMGKLGLKCGTDGYYRHPLSYLTEAADDICYRVSDFDDAVRMRILEESEVRRLFLDGMTSDQQAEEKDAPFQHVRARAIGYLIDEFANCFINNYDAIMDCSFQGDLRTHLNGRWSGVLNRINQRYEQIFLERKKVLVEVGAYRNFTTVLNAFKDFLARVGQRLPYGELPGMYKHLIDLSIGKEYYEKNKFQEQSWWAHTVLDYVVGMTDEYMRTLANTL